MISAVSAGVSSAAIDEYLLGWNNAGLINSTVKYTLIEAAGQLIADRLGQLPKAKDPTYAMMDDTC